MIRDESLTRVALIGGGRWARTIASVLDGVLAPQVAITIHSPRNAGEMARWVAGRFPKRSVEVFGFWPEFRLREPSALIVANSAIQHEAAARLGLLAGVPVLVEKPVAPTSEAVCRLCALANETGTRLCAGLVFRFARYNDNFVQTVRAMEAVRGLEIRWADPIGERIRGESKSYDSSLPVFVDCLPHIVSMIAPFISDQYLSVRGLLLARGGAELTLDMAAGATTVHLVLARNADRRERWVAAKMASGISVSLDFSTEPGMISSPQGDADADLLWGDAPSPMAALLSAFLTGVSTGEWDPRLSPELALQGARLADDVLPQYRSAQAVWIATQRQKSQAECDSTGLYYATRELLHVEAPHLF